MASNPRLIFFEQIRESAEDKTENKVGEIQGRGTGLVR